MKILCTIFLAAIAAVLSSLIWIFRKQKGPRELLFQLPTGLLASLYALLDEPFLESSTVHEEQLWREVGGIQGILDLCRWTGILVQVCGYFASLSPGGAIEEYREQKARLQLLVISFLACLLETVAHRFSKQIPRLHARYAAKLYAEACITTRTLVEQYHPEMIENLEGIL